jgi:hypothetical protein
MCELWPEAALSEAELPEEESGVPDDETGAEALIY